MSGTLQDASADMAAVHSCEVLVIGSGVSGYCAAIQAGREGCRTILLEKDEVLGGNSGPNLGVGITGGDLDTIGQDGEIYEILLKQLWAEWDHIKNGPHREEARNWDLLWVSPKAGKRESRRFLGDVILTQSDLESGRRFADDIAYGGHDLDDHQCLGTAGSNIFGHSIPPLYGIPFRSCYSRNLDNLLLAGRLISATHLAHSSTRLMRTGGAIGQAVGLAAALCVAHDATPCEIYRRHLAELQRQLMAADGAILCRFLERTDDLARQAKVEASSEMRFNEQLIGQMAPLVAQAGNLLWDWPAHLHKVKLYLKNGSDAVQSMTLRVLHARGGRTWTTVERYRDHGWNDLSDASFAPITELNFGLPGGFAGWFEVPFASLIALPPKDAARDADRLIVALDENQQVWWGVGNEPGEIGEMIEHSHHEPRWHSLPAMGAMQIFPTIPLGESVQVIDGYHRRFSRGPTHLWLSRPQDGLPQDLVLRWNEPRQFSRIEITFDNLLANRHDQPWESGRRVHPMLVKAYEVSIQNHEQWIEIARENENHHRFRRHTFAPVAADRLRLRILETHGGKGQARVYQIAVFDA